MPGKNCVGHTESTNILRDSKSYCDGVTARFRSGATTNPHTVGTPEYTQFAEGITDAAAGTVRACSCYRGQTAP